MKKAIEMKAILAAYHAMRAVASNKEAFEQKRVEFLEAARPLTAELDEVQKRSRTRTISAETICMILNDYTNDLSIPKKDMEGIEIDVNPLAQPFPNAYKGIPQTTWFYAVYKRGSWRVTNIYRYDCKTWKLHAKLTDAAKAALANRFEWGWR